MKIELTISWSWVWLIDRDNFAAVYYRQRFSYVRSCVLHDVCIGLGLRACGICGK